MYFFFVISPFSWQLTKDERSDNEEEDDDDEGENSTPENTKDGHQKVTNGCGANHH